MRLPILAAPILAAPIGVAPIGVALILLAPAAASAHAILMQSDPPDRSTVPAGPRNLVLHYNSRIDHTRSRLTLQGTNAQKVLPLEDGSGPDVLAAKADLSPGDYVVHWQVLATDGHLTRGDLRFRVTAP